MKYLYTIHGKLWFDKVNGNTYCSGRITRHSDGASVEYGREYGYGDQYKYIAIDRAIKAWGVNIHAGECLAYASYGKKAEMYRGGE
jgi:hypothetical protein